MPFLRCAFEPEEKINQKHDEHISSHQIGERASLNQPVPPVPGGNWKVLIIQEDCKGHKQCSAYIG
jgi:hypothetical protein